MGSVPYCPAEDTLDCPAWPCGVPSGFNLYFLYQAEQTKEEQKQDLNAERLMRQVSKDVCRLREQSQKEPRQVQSFR